MGSMGICGNDFYGRDTELWLEYKQTKKICDKIKADS